jgi:hypothetical protein
MNAAAIVIIAIAASGVLMMRFRTRWLAKINIAFTNRTTGLFAGWLPGFGILTHVGASKGFIIALTYGRAQSDVLRRVLHIEYSASITVGKGLELAVA